MKLGTLGVLIWKHYVVRKRRFIHTPVEFLSPMCFFLLLFLYRNEINPIRKHALDARDGAFNVEVPEPMHLSKSRSPPTVLYLPNTELTQVLMTLVIDKLTGFGLRNYYPLSNDSASYNYTKNLKHNDAIVIFHNLNDSVWPQSLNYTIRMKTSFLTHLEHSLDGNRVPHSGFGTIYEQFMKLQWTIDTSYLELLGNPVKQDVVLQEFPYARHESNQAAENVCLMLRLFCWLALLLVFVFLMSRLLEERASGIQELMHMMGVSRNKLVIAHILNIVFPWLVYAVSGAVFLTVSSNPLLKNTAGYLIFVGLSLYFLTIVAMAFMCSFLTKSMQYAVSLSVLSYVFLWIPVSQLQSFELPRAALYACGLLPHMPMAWLWHEVGQLEKYGQGLTFSTMFSSHTAYSGSVAAAFVLFLLQAGFYFLLAWYLAHVFPGQYGQSLPWNFLCQRQYWRKIDVAPNSETDEQEEPMTQDQKYFESQPDGLDVAIKIMNVTKVYPKQRALNNVSFDIYKGEITLLLGHNGAGKTTLMSIITGMTSATEGKVYVHGLDIASQKDEVRRHLGLCPQHNLFFSDLTVMEHVLFFTLLKGGTFGEAHVSAEKLLDKLLIKDKANNKSSELSGGMKRRLQLACALAGDASVLILDEPTSGLDVETRRELWDLLLSLRGSHTVLLSTHFMEEADALGDRVAALHAGRLRCFATPMYLKKAIGTGYRLTLTTEGSPNEPAITDAIHSLVPNAALKEVTINSASYSLPAGDSHNFPNLFAKLESKRMALGIHSMGVGISTLEEVFLRLCSDTDTQLTQDEVDGDESGTQLPKITGPILYLRQLVVLLKRQFKYVWAKQCWFLILQVVLPVFMIMVFTYGSNNGPSYSSSNPEVAMNMDMYKSLPERRVLFAAGADPSPLVAGQLPMVKFERADAGISDVILRASQKDALEYNKYIAGIEINATNIKVMYTTTVRHAAPVALNLASNLVAAAGLPWAGGRTFTTHNHPLVAAADPLRQAKQAKHLPATIMWAVTIVFIILATNINSVSLPCKERVSGTRHIHVMSGVSPELHWMTTLLFNTIIAFVTLIIPTLIACVALDTDQTLTEHMFLANLTVVLVLGCVSFFGLMYLVSFYFEERGSSIILVLAIIIFGLVMPLIKSLSEVFSGDSSKTFTGYLLQLSSYVMSPHTFTMAISHSAMTARLNAFCRLNMDMCPNLLAAEMNFDPEKCCASSGTPYCFFCTTNLAPGSLMLALALQTVIYMVLVFLTERGYFKLLCDKMMNSRYRPPAPRYRDEMVRAERTYVNKAIDLQWNKKRPETMNRPGSAVPRNNLAEADVGPSKNTADEATQKQATDAIGQRPPATKQISDTMLVSDVHKNYRKLWKSCNAVKGISFSIKKGECFGLLGVNGAGKSSTFKMLTGEDFPTRGRVFANNQSKYSSEYLQGLGYCPQFFGLDEFQTGRENLSLLLTLRGHTGSNVQTQVDSWINIVGLGKYGSRAVSGYSGGCVRRLAAAAALSSGAGVTLLDEPTAGVDVAARRRVWAALRRGLRAPRAVIITSHSMDEMEALCDRIAIMSAGELCALGPAPALRAAHAAGHALYLKLAHRPSTDETDSSKSKLNDLKSKLQQKFNCTLKDEHKTMLHYHINDTMQYSDLFKELEALKASFPQLLEDYSITETTLEEVFLSFARNVPEVPPPARPV